MSKPEPKPPRRHRLVRLTIALLGGFVSLIGVLALTSSTASAQPSSDQTTCYTVLRPTAGAASFDLVEIADPHGDFAVTTVGPMPGGDTSIQSGAIRPGFGYYYIHPNTFQGYWLEADLGPAIAGAWRSAIYSNVDGLTFVGTDDAIASNDVLYVSIRSTGSPSDQIQAVDPASGAPLGDPMDIDLGEFLPADAYGQNDLTALAWEPGTNFIYAVAGNALASSLIRIDLTNGQSQLLTRLSGSPDLITGLSFDGDGRLLGSSDFDGVGRLVTVNTASGVLTELGTLPANVGMQSLACTNGRPLTQPPVSARETTCQAGKGIVRVDVTNDLEPATFQVTAIGRLTGFKKSKDLTLGAGESGFVGFSGRPDEAYRFEVRRDGELKWSLGGFTGLADGPDSLIGSSRPGATVHCGDDDVVIVANECVFGSGAVYISLRNSTAQPGTQQYRFRLWYETQVVDQPGMPFPGVSRAAFLAAGERVTFGVGGRSQDIGVLMEGRRFVSGGLLEDGIEAGSGAVLIDCQGEPNRFGTLTSCLEENGRLDFFVFNPADSPLQYRVSWIELLGPFRRVDYFTVPPGERMRATLTGRNDGVFRVSAGPTFLTEEPPPGETSPIDPPADIITELAVSCDPEPSVEVTLRTTCLSGAGRLDIGLGNVTDSQQTYTVEVMDGNLGPRTRTIAPGERAVVTYTGRSINRVLEVTVKRGDLLVFDRLAFAECY